MKEFSEIIFHFSCVLVRMILTESTWKGRTVWVRGSRNIFVCSLINEYCVECAARWTSDYTFGSSRAETSAIGKYGIESTMRDEHTRIAGAGGRARSQLLNLCTRGSLPPRIVKICQMWIPVCKTIRIPTYSNENCYPSINCESLLSSSKIALEPPSNLHNLQRYAHKAFSAERRLKQSKYDFETLAGIYIIQLFLVHKFTKFAYIPFHHECKFCWNS